MMPTSATIVAPIIVVLSFSLSAAAQSHDWPQWLGPSRDGLTQETGLLQSWPDGGPELRWLFEDCGAGYSGPAIVAGKLFILGTRDDQSQLFALDADSGEELWATPIGELFINDWGDGPRNTPTVDGDRVYALGADGTLLCVRADNGQEIWRTTMESLGGSVPNWGFASSVLIDDNKVICTPGGKQGAIAALDKLTGKMIWQSADVTDPAHYASVVRAEIHGQPQYVQLFEKRLVGVSAKDGRLLWETPWPGRTAVIPTPIVDGNQVFVTSGYGSGCKLVEITSKNEVKTVYANKHMKNHHGGVIHLGKFAYGHSNDVGWLCMDFRTGKQKWRERDALGKGAISYADGRFYCVDESEGNVVLIDASPEGWVERGRFTLAPQTANRKPRGGIWVHPVISDGKLFLRDQEYLYCYNVKEEK